jgi:hypothetical protein
MKENRDKRFKIMSEIKIVASGIFAWLLLSFAMLKLGTIYAPNPVLAYVIIYNIAGIIFLLYFFAFLKKRLNFLFLMMLILIYNGGIPIFGWVYNNLILIKQPGINVALVVVCSLINIHVLLLEFLVLKLIIKPRIA